MRAEENRIHVAPFLVLGEEGMNGDGYVCDVRFGHPNRETSDQTHPVAVKANARGDCSMVRIPMSCAAKGDETFLFSYACNDDDTNHCVRFLAIFSSEVVVFFWFYRPRNHKYMLRGPCSTISASPLARIINLACSKFYFQ